MKTKGVLTIGLIVICGLFGLGVFSGVTLGGPNAGPVETGNEAVTADDATLASRLPELTELGPGWADAVYQPSAESRCPLKGAVLYTPAERENRAFDGGDKFVVFTVSRYADGDAARVLTTLQTGGEDCFQFSDDAGTWKTLTERDGETLTLTLTNTRPNGQVIGVVATYRKAGETIASTLLATYGGPNPTLAKALADKMG